MNIEIKNHLLFIDGQQVPFKKTPNISGAKNKLQYLIEHYTATYGAESPISWLTSSESQVSAHLVVDKQGRVTQLAPFDAVCWHAGVSQWKGIIGMNSYAIGIEIVNSGLLHQKVDGWYSPDGHKVENFKKLTNKLGVVGVWEIYPDVQIETVSAISKALKEHYSLKEIIGHEDVSPRRKTDPGPAFPWSKILGEGTESEVITKTTLAKINLRDAPNGKIITTIDKNVTIEIPTTEYKTNGDWTYIGNGWVSSKYLI